ncbi:PREDICTED: uncharacterized protein LOC105449840 [Wasmannia auropunctata]|uniref:uncharacterized protein LOC105449840 n=1 Tax=Wasmannia auropunctata TaxID=64793 RepID=UPI0005F08226|nr:PREDICTED: uncharacterized protein LOC105449840 [Wasmannia auropunctata]XP_011687543.1 PREDICTED: uncharacterized protein LOC105449840 [Wasmannia auropunctata]XP_011687544.1 PREDICTED: uncharacterized protein LOC105449840 [Wasmannia auropunctata]XP_011687545.1 PREDICTED: uncharacterized protein LOC105449840 [Wasmannia auropunctata]XP_011687546.1 PREDICTED: uncharacterized protein LOC105449840 [Wasmannia auropunctata]
MDVNVGDNDDVSFRPGEMFDSYEELEQKLDRVSRHTLVHYWRRDSRTVSGAHMKTARPISERLKYYSVKYACIYGGQKFLPRGAGRRQSQSIRTNCPAHIMVRASKDGTKLEVTSVNNEHNHEISEDLFKRLPQERKLCGEIKQEVQDLMQLHIDRKRLKEYVRLRTNKVLRSKDLFNIAAANRQKKDIPPERAYQLLEKIRNIEKMQARCGRKMYSESEDEIARTIKRIKKEHESAWNQDGLSTAELEAGEGNDGEDSYGGQLTQEEVVDEIDANEGELLRSNNEGDIIAADEEIVGELVMENGDPSVIVESIVNADGSVFVDEREFNSYCDNHLSHTVDDSQSPKPRVLDIETITSTTVIEKIAKETSASPNDKSQADSLTLQQSPKSPGSFQETDSRIWIMKECNSMETEPESGPESETNVIKPTSAMKPDAEASEALLSDDTSHQLLQEQLAVLRAEKGKLYHETEMLKLKKDKLKLQINCYSNEIKKQEMEREKLRLEIKLLQSKVMEDTNDVSHYIFVP